MDLAINLRTVVETYVAVAGGYGKSVALSSLGLSPEDTERIFSIFDEDYRISRFLHFRNASGEKYKINGFPQTHVSLDAEVQEIL
jgi:hypothetical protein